ncbi:hypothetical protein NEUTE1DRAFT_90955 [Neurospora tetrasperma FGSC 2508]|uniref:R3H domain-containing protein n=1 Tax=Neurospora tetrasperma (strain FGSC 2508 / ATCC MYA-4615 / P0657) TaxID=510951 RepID=F8N330_NEUT8|nr:uncharacterized protein NEUTE1DRAFT_90955 [Neurospora tetrasperma FGSC 2508]EGO52541.1 hypothetical protein NEUTE1DRAFT_90955 [Neurospora tetrasperma FGSC 2508]
MADVQPATHQGGSDRGGRGGRGRGRGRGRGGRPRRGHHGSERPNTGGDASQPVQSAESSRNLLETANVNVPPPSVLTPDAPSGHSREEGEGRRRRGGGGGGPRRGRGVSSAQRSIVVSHRGRAPPPGTAAAPSTAEEHDTASGAGLSADAPAFVPGQPLAVPTQQPRAAAAKRQKEHRPAPSNTSKSSAPDLTTRIHEDIASGLYECVICTNELTRNTRIWSCSVCWTVTHLSHECGERCCPGEKKAAERRKKKNRGPNENYEAEHICLQCPSLMDKLCICGKEIMKNRPCWNNEVHCGLPCGKKLKCGSHVGKKTCHKPGDCEDAGIPGSHCTQACGKVRKSCEHTCAEQCHAPYPCKEDKPCQSKTFITCPCQNRKQEVRCMATMLSPSSARESSLKCDDECLRLQRNRKLANALKIDDTHTDDHIPYSDKTLKMFKENVNWSQTQEREFRVFASSPDEKRLRFKPMPSSQRAFLHSLAEDFGLDSESQDPEPHRHVCIFKTPRFVAAPSKTLAQCARIAKATASLLKPAAAAPVVAPPKQEAFNALLLKEPRFGLTIEELDQALAADIKSVAKSGLTAVGFTTNFLPTEEILIKAVPASTAAAIANSPIAPTPQAIESALMTLKSAVTKTVSLSKLATGGVVLCHADDSLNVVRREAESGRGGVGGWNAVASRGSWGRLGGGSKTSTAEPEKAAAPLTRSFVTLRKIMEKKPVVEVKKRPEVVEEDWEAAAEKEEEQEQEKEKSGTSGSDSEGEAEGQSKIVSVDGDVQEGNGVTSDTERSVDTAAHEEKEPDQSLVDGRSSSASGEQVEIETEMVAATMNA